MRSFWNNTKESIHRGAFFTAFWTAFILWGLFTKDTNPHSYLIPGFMLVVSMHHEIVQAIRDKKDD